VIQAMIDLDGWPHSAYLTYRICGQERFFQEDVAVSDHFPSVSESDTNLSRYQIFA
jgi:hypothetical protein